MQTFKEFLQQKRASENSDKKKQPQTAQRVTIKKTVTLDGKDMEEVDKIAKSFRRVGAKQAKMNAMGRVALKKFGLDTPAAGVVTTDNPSAYKAYMDPFKMSRAKKYTAMLVDLAKRTVGLIGTVSQQDAMPHVKADTRSNDQLWIPLSIFA